MMITHDLLTPGSFHKSRAESLASPHVFIAVKHPVITEVVTWTLELAGYRLTKSTEGLATFSQIPREDLPAAILLDVGLVLGSGSKVLADIQTQCTTFGITVPIIVLTSSSAIQKEIERGGIRALCKPFHTHDLKRAIYEAIYSIPI